MVDLAEDVLGQILTDVIHITLLVIQFKGPSWNFISSHHYDLDLALKSPSIAKKIILAVWHGLKAFQTLQGNHQTQ